MKIEFGKEYEYEEVKDIVRKKQLYILDEVVKICDKHGLIYWLDGGTLLGAIRHQGFIPWDDDIDIGLMRKDYEKLLAILSQELPSDLVLQSRKTDKKYKLPFIKIRDRFSKIEDEYEFNGIFIDIFPFDIMPKSDILRKIQYLSFMFLEATMIYTDIQRLNINKKRGLKNFLFKNLLKVLYKIGSFLDEKQFDYIYNQICNISLTNPSDEVGDGLAASWAYYKSIRAFDVYFPVRQALFENKLYNIPNKPKKYLESLYGKDFMTPKKTYIGHISKVVFFK